MSCVPILRIVVLRVGIRPIADGNFEIRG